MQNMEIIERGEVGVYSVVANPGVRLWEARWGESWKPTNWP